MRNLTFVSALVVLTACANTAPILSGSGGGQGDAQGGGAGAKPASAFSQFPDIPVPTGTRINTEKTLVFGSKPWYGQLALEFSGSANALFDFYRDNLANYGWQEITSVRAPTSILTYATPERVLAIAIQSGTLTGSNVTITVSPRGQQQPLGGGAPAPVQRLNQ